jgi:hypothetical protein
MCRCWLLVSLAAFFSVTGLDSTAYADEKKENDKKADAAVDVTGNSDDFKPLNKSGTVLLDVKGKRLLLRSQVVLREGLLELLVCLKRTKEHESILAVDAPAQIIHAGLLALGATTGTPVRWQPDFQAATGQPIDIFLTWTDEDGKLHRDSAQSWVRHATRRYFVEKLDPPPKSLKIPPDSDLKWDSKNFDLLWYGHMSESQRDDALKISSDPQFQKAIKSIFKQSQIRQMEEGWVFAGSYFVTDEKSGEKFYQAESGDLICVANFATATLDLSASSSATNDDLMFEAFTERVPPLGTNVTIELIPNFKAQPNAKKAKLDSKN